MVQRTTLAASSRHPPVPLTTTLLERLAICLAALRAQPSAGALLIASILFLPDGLESVLQRLFAWLPRGRGDVG